MGCRLCPLSIIVGVLLLITWARCEEDTKVPLPSFQSLVRMYPGYAHHGGRYHNHHLVRLIGPGSQDRELLLHDTSALRLSYALNRVGGPHSLGRQLIRLSKFGHDSISGSDGLEYIFHPIAYGPFLADKYGYPSVSKLHAQDPVSTKKNFWGRQGILRVITYTRKNNMPKGHVALWDCNHFHQTQDWVAGHTLLTVEFWESPDSNCSQMSTDPRYLSHSQDLSGGPRLRGRKPSSSSPSSYKHSGGWQRSSLALEANKPHPKLRHKHWELRQFLSRHGVITKPSPSSSSLSSSHQEQPRGGQSSRHGYTHSRGSKRSRRSGARSSLRSSDRQRARARL